MPSDIQQNGVDASAKKEGEVRIWADGCYDVGHFGHANSLRQAKALGTHLIVGVHSDAEIMKHKGPPLFNEVERYAMIRAIRWVDEVVEEAPYVTQLETLDKYGCDFCAHGNDITTDAAGNDTYQIVKDAGRYEEVNRTLGVSTTDIIGRMLQVGKPTKENANNNITDISSKASPWTGGKSQFSVTTQKLAGFASGNDILKYHKIVLAYGCFDVFHPGHINYLKAAKEHGDFLLVGVFDDAGVKATIGSDYPIMSLNERIMSVLACIHVDDIIIGFSLTNLTEILREYKVSAVVHPPKVNGEPLNVEVFKQDVNTSGSLNLAFDNPDEMTKNILARVDARREEFEKRNMEKEEKEVKIIAASFARKEIGPIEL